MTRLWKESLPWSSMECHQQKQPKTFLLTLLPHFVSGCTGFGWGRVNFLCHSLYGAMLWGFDENRVDNSTGMCKLPLSSAYTASKLLLLLTLMHQWAGWGWAGGLEGTDMGQSWPLWQKGHPIPYNITISSKSCEEFARAAVVRGLARHQLARGQQLLFLASVVFLGLFFCCCFLCVCVCGGFLFVTFFVSFLFYLLNCVYLNPYIYSLCPSYSLPQPMAGVSQQLCGTELPTRANTQQQAVTTLYRAVLKSRWEDPHQKQASIYWDHTHKEKMLQKNHRLSFNLLWML